MNIFKKILMLFMLGNLILNSSLSYADDIEIFINKTQTSHKVTVNPNILFVLDDSGSMQEGTVLMHYRYLQGKRWQTGPTCPIGSKYCSAVWGGEMRANVLINTMNELIDTLTNINIGIMTYASSAKRIGDGFVALNQEMIDLDTADKDKLKGIVYSSLKASGGTPTAEAVYQAATYMSELHHNNKYPKSPIKYECQKNHIILLSDGAPSRNGDLTNKNIKDLTGKNTCTWNPSKDTMYGGQGTDCIAEFLATKDQSSLPGDQFITTDAIGFAILDGSDEQTYLDTIVKAGGGGKIDPATGKPNGKAYLASEAKDLKDAFTSIISGAQSAVIDQNISNNNIDVSINSSNRAVHADSVFYPMYKPSTSAAWDGNIKRYQLKKINGIVKVFDANGVEAFNPNSTKLKDNARSFWSSTADGDNLEQGGVASKLPNSNDRKRVFFKNDHTPADANVNLLATNEYKFTNQNISSGSTTFTKILADANIAPSQYEVLRKYAIGLKDGTNESKILGDSHNSAPSAIAYRCPTALDSNGRCTITDPNTGDVTDNSDGIVVFGTNEGFVHFADIKTGTELAAFMPAQLVPNLDKLQKNGEGKVYGIDNPVTLWKNDLDRNGYIYKANESNPTTGEIVLAYVTMRRGGNAIYALDVTNILHGQLYLKWQIIGGKDGTKGFEDLGQTWSQPVKTRVRINGQIKDVLVFGGGYDESEDDFNEASGAKSGYNKNTTKGNAIYIVDALTDAKIWSAGSKAEHDLTLPSMLYSIPARVKVVATNADARANGLSDQIFVGDMGGQVWRLFINNDATSANQLVTVGTNKGLFAQLGSDEATQARRFYAEPDVALQVIDGKNVLTVNVGSGYRAHPLNTVIEDRFYSLRSTNVIPNVTDPATLNDVILTESSLYDCYGKSNSV